MASCWRPHNSEVSFRAGHGLKAVQPDGTRADSGRFSLVDHFWSDRPLADHPGRVFVESLDTLGFQIVYSLQHRNGPGVLGATSGFDWLITSERMAHQYASFLDSLIFYLSRPDETRMERYMVCSEDSIHSCTDFKYKVHYIHSTLTHSSGNRFCSHAGFTQKYCLMETSLIQYVRHGLHAYTMYVDSG